MGTRLHAIREACGLEPDLRSEENINDILDFVKDVKFFTRLSVLQQRSLCRTMSLEEFGPREYVSQIGEVGDKFYIILTGSVGVQVPSQTAPCPNDVHADRCDCPNRPLEIVVFLEKGIGFGELALQSDQPRSATIQTSEKTELLVTKRADYEMYAGQLHRQFIEQRVKFLRQCPRIEDALQGGLVSTQDIAAMANCLNEVQLAGNAVACRQGDVVDHMIFVRSGQLAALRCVDLEQSAREASLKNERKGRARSMTGTSSGSMKGGDKDDKDKEPHQQPQWQLTQSFAKAVLDLRKKEKRSRDGLPDEDVEERVKGADDSSRKPRLSGESGSLAAGHGKALWKRLQRSMKAASALNRFLGGAQEHEHETGIEAARHNVEHFASVQAARRKYTQYTFKKIMGADKIKKTGMSAPLRRQSSMKPGKEEAASSSKAETASSKKRTRILRIGTLGPYEYFGDQQVTNNEAYPMSLVSDPVAEIYIMSKHDIQRRVPKKLFNALFNLEKDVVPSDVQLLEMHKQTERWNAFRRSMHGEALSNLSSKNQLCGGGYRGGPSSGNSRIDAVANLEFLGISPHTNLGSSLVPLPQSKGVFLTPKDEELFSQASARFLRRFDIMKRDPGLRVALKKAGHMRNNRLHDGLPGSSLDDDDEDPMAFRFDQHWYKLQKDPIGVDLDDVLSEGATQQLPSANTSMAVAAPSIPPPSNHRTSVRTRRISKGDVGSPDPKRSSFTNAPGRSEAHGSLSSVPEAGSGDDLSPRSGRSSTMAHSAMESSKRRQSARTGATNAAGPGATVELPLLDSGREGRSSSRPTSNQNTGRRVVGFSDP